MSVYHLWFNLTSVQRFARRVTATFMLDAGVRPLGARLGSGGATQTWRSRSAPKLRAHNLGVTDWLAEGRMGQREVLMVVARRKHTQQVMRLLEDLDPEAFVVQMDARWYKGGVVQRMLTP
ncbi:MAG: DUF2179 domain-containing protein [Symbiobacterium sp.]|jgi:Uncharacterized protein conserved in bacteria (DUF2179).|uniref:DUF2179 domain-containing protein n=1 Tax=Symbiobacterium sp. TaxID=1971213 RepID=UPI003464C1CB